jgi:type I restriction enzyme S subunit
MRVEKKVPEIRFNGFSDEWEEKLLNKEVELFSGLTYSPKDIRKEGVFVIRSSNVKNGHLVNADNVYVNPEVVNCTNVKKGDVIVVVRNGSRSLIGKHAQVNSSMDQTVIGAFMTGVRAKQPEFINALFDTNQFTAQVEKNLGATINQITNGAFNSMAFMFPEELEQTVIGNTFQKLDSLIKEHQKKHDKLSNIKKAMLEKMFPKEGETVPEIRFKGFSGEWKEVPLSSAIDVRSGKDYKHLDKGSIPVYGTGGYMLSVDSALSLDEDAIGIGRKGTIDKPYILRAPFWTVDTLFYAVPFPSFKLGFLFCLFQKIEWKNHDESTGVPSLSKVAINNVRVFVTNDKEQTTIGNYFQKLDALINQHQKQITKLNNIKQACLSKMFV